MSWLSGPCIVPVCPVCAHVAHYGPCAVVDESSGDFCECDGMDPNADYWHGSGYVSDG